MNISNKLTSIPPNQIVSEIDKLLPGARVRISWWAKRMVHIKGYKGEVEINDLANKYLQALPFQPNQDASLQDRLECYNLFEKVQSLYKKSDLELGKHWIYWFLTRLREFRPWCRACAGDPQAIIGEWECSSTKKSLFLFTPEKFKQLWPNLEPLEKWTYLSKDILGGIEKWSATKEIVERAIQQTAQQ